MAIFCDNCGNVISTIYLIRKDNLTFCSYRCYKCGIKDKDLDFLLHKKKVEKELLGIKEGMKDNKGLLDDGDISSNTMVWAASFERQGEYKKAINCWKRILLLHRNDVKIVERAERRIKILERKLLSKRRALKEANINGLGKRR